MPGAALPCVWNTRRLIISSALNEVMLPEGFTVQLNPSRGAECYVSEPLRQRAAVARYKWRSGGPFRKQKLPANRRSNKATLIQLVKEHEFVISTLWVYSLQIKAPPPSVPGCPWAPVLPAPHPGPSLGTAATRSLCPPAARAFGTKDTTTELASKYLVSKRYCSAA